MEVYQAVYRLMRFADIVHNARTLYVEKIVRERIHASSEDEARAVVNSHLANYHPHFRDTELNFEALFRACPDKPKTRR